MTVWEQIAARMRGIAGETVEAKAPPVRRGKVIKASPLIIDLGEFTIEEGDEDVEIDEALKQTRPEVGDLVRVHTADDGDYIVSGTIKGG